MTITYVVEYRPAPHAPRREWRAVAFVAQDDATSWCSIARGESAEEAKRQVEYQVAIALLTEVY